MPDRAKSIEQSQPAIYVVSGSAGASGEHLVQTALAQFPSSDLPVEILGNVRRREQVESIVLRVARSGGCIAHTLVDASLRRALVREARKHHVPEVDLMGPLLLRLSRMLGSVPLGQPGLYRQLQREYFERVSAIEFTLAHDDGMHPDGWPLADVVLVGVSRSGKTPLSVYLSVLGWRVANVPLVLDLPVPEGLFALERQRVIGLTIGLDRLLSLRKRRIDQMGLSPTASYTDPQRIQEELRFAAKVCHQHGFRLIDVSDRPIESTADDVVRLVSGKQGAPGDLDAAIG
jgi:regulator of PEP synthase PpsR (kinase-PPPase family)